MHSYFFTVSIIFAAVLACTKSKSSSPTSVPVTAGQTLSKLIVIADELKPTFDPFVNVYTLAYGETYKNKIQFNLAAVDPKVEIQVNGVKLRSDFTTDPLPLAAGENIFTIDLLNSPGSKINSYQVTVQRAQELPDESIAGIDTSDGTIMPSFSPDIVEYTLTVSKDTSVLTVSPLVVYPDEATLEINGVSYPADNGGYDVNIAPGSNIVTLIMRGKSGRTKTYTITVTRPVAP